MKKFEVSTSMWGCSCFHCAAQCSWADSWRHVVIFLQLFRDWLRLHLQGGAGGLVKPKLMTRYPTVLCLSPFCVGAGSNAIPLREYFYWILSPQMLEDLRQQSSYLYLNINLLGPELLYAQTGLAFNNSTFCPHSVFMCFVWLSEQTAIISLYSINLLVFITETACVYCAVRTGSLDIIPRTAHTLYWRVLYGSQNKQRSFSYTALTDWFL
jgi:hypothetical protein